ncbi:DegV family protein [Atopococcus tabaci]|uniref:DegV family protein n=1 Tax=Atopococcus tabaci TaxID=269774 RepID=UPI0004817838|nr:DegV family protein [Atopococcus tabaci]
MPPELAKRYNIYTVPMHVIMDGVDYLDGSIPVQKIVEHYLRDEKDTLHHFHQPGGIPGTLF